MNHGRTHIPHTTQWCRSKDEEFLESFVLTDTSTMPRQTSAMARQTSAKTASRGTIQSADAWCEVEIVMNCIEFKLICYICFSLFV